MAENTLTTEQMNAIADANGDIAKRKTIKETFATRVQGFWAGSAMGMIYGAAMGAIVAVAASVAGATLGTLFLPLVATYALAGTALGATIMTAVSAPAGAAASSAREAERRKILSNPDAALTEAAKYNEAIQDPQDKKLLHRILPFSEGSKHVFDPRAALIFAAVAVAASAALLTIAGPAALTALTGVIGAHAFPAVAAAIAIKPVEITIGLTTAALFGATFGFDGPTMAGNAVQFVSDVFSGKKLGFSKSKAPEMIVTPAPASAAAPLYEKVTPEEAAQLHAKLDAGNGKSFTQNINVQQLQVAPAGQQV